MNGVVSPAVHVIGKSLRFSKHAESKSKAAVYVAFELRMEVA
jgi:hypothetical protein